MKRVGNLMEMIASPDNLRQAFIKAAKGKRWKKDCLKFQLNIDNEIEWVRKGLIDGNIRIGDYHYFTIHDPKKRLICAASFRERVLHHAVMGVCESTFESLSVSDSYACRRGKGALKAMSRALSFGSRHRWFLKMDVKKYFDSVHHSTLINLLSSRFKDPALLALFKRIIESYCTASGRGLPIGNLTSQYFANFYLGGLDRFIKESLKRSAYVRYMDDFVVWGDSSDDLAKVKLQVFQYLEDILKLELKSSTALNQTWFGMDFLGYRIYPNTVRLARRSKVRFSRKKSVYEKLFLSGNWTELQLQRRMTALIAFVKPANTVGFRRRCFNQFRVATIGLEPRDSRWQLEQQCGELPSGEPQQQQPWQQEQQQRVPLCFAPSSTNASDECEVDPVGSPSPASQPEVAGKYTVIRSGASSADSSLHRTLPTGSLN